MTDNVDKIDQMDTHNKKPEDSDSDEIDLMSSGDESKKSMKSNQDSINARIRNLSQSTSVNAYDSDLFEESSDEEKIVTKNGDYDLTDMFGVANNNDEVKHDLTTCEGNFFFFSPITCVQFLFQKSIFFFKNQFPKQ